MKKMIEHTIKMVLLIGVFVSIQKLPLLAQSKDKGEMKVVIIKEYTDANGNRKVERIERDGKDLENNEMQKILEEHDFTMNGDNGRHNNNKRSSSNDKGISRTIEVIGDDIFINGEKQNVKEGKPGMRNFNFDRNDGFKGVVRIDNENSKPILGVNLNTDDSNVKGALVSSVVEKSGAEKAGIQKGDIITKVDQKQINSADDLIATIASYKGGQEVVIYYTRGGKQMQTNAKLGNKQDSSEMGGEGFDLDQFKDFAKGFKDFDLPNFKPFEGRGFDPRGPKLGIQVEDREDRKGVIVKTVEPDGLGAKAGILANDIILYVADDRIDDVDDLQDTLFENKDNDNVKVSVKRNDMTTNLQINLKREALKPPRKTLKM